MIRAQTQILHQINLYKIQKNKIKICASVTVRSFLGFCNFYRPFIPSFSKITKPLNELTCKDVPFVWEDKHEAAFNALRDLVTSEPALRQPQLDKPFEVEVDAVTAAWLLSVKLSNFGFRSDRPEMRETLHSLEEQQTRPPHVPVMYHHLFHHLINLIPSFPFLITSAFNKHPSIVHIANPI